MKRATIDLLLDTLRLRDGITADVAQQRWAEADVQSVLALARYEGAEPWLYRRLHQLQVPLAPDVKATLRGAAHSASMRNMRIDAQAIAVIGRLRAAGIDVALIKGQARRAATSLYPYADARSVSDVDLLVPESRLEDAWAVLCGHGFRPLDPAKSTPRAGGRHHSPGLIDDNGVGVELHWTLSIQVPGPEAWRRCTEHGDTVLWNGMEWTVPNATELVWQALTHGVLDQLDGYRLRTMLNVSSVLAARPDVDWALFASRLASGEVIEKWTNVPVPHERVRRYLDAAAALAGVEVPVMLRPRRPAALATLLHWRARMVTSTYPRMVRERLLEEAARAEILFPVTPADPAFGVWRGVRRRVGSLTARVGYVAWRAAQ